MQVRTEAESVEYIPQNIAELIIRRSHRIKWYLRMVLSCATVGIIISNIAWYVRLFCIRD